MSHITCKKCGSNDHLTGYGFAAGGMGAYTLCNGCDEVLEFFPDPECAQPEDAKPCPPQKQT